MRIIAGKYKGRRLIAPRTDAVRPTSDMVREAVFNILQQDIEGARVLDLFAGSGALGIEALSRGAESVFFNDVNSDAIRAITQNLSFVSELYQLRQGDFSGAIAGLKSDRFDIVFIDPPYNSDVYERAIALSSEVLSEDGKIVVEHDARHELKQLPNGIITKTTRRYGNKRITILVGDNLVE